MYSEWIGRRSDGRRSRGRWRIERYFHLDYSQLLVDVVIR